MSDVFIGYPLADVIECEFCERKPARMLDDTKRHQGIFRAASRKQNYTLHLRKKHDVADERIKVRCSVCGRVSEKPIRTAWRDTQAHYRREHRRVQLEPTLAAEAVEDLGDAPPILPRLADSTTGVNVETSGQEVDVQVQAEDVIADLSSHSLPPTPLGFDENPLRLRDFSPILDVTVKQEEESRQSNSSVIGAMGQMFNVVVGAVAAASQEPTYHSTPMKTLPDEVAEINFLPDGAQVSRIVPKARPPIRASRKRRLPSPSATPPPKRPLLAGTSFDR